MFSPLLSPTYYTKDFSMPLSLHNDHDLKEEIREGARILMISFDDAVELYLASPSNFRRLVAEEERQWRNK